MNNISFDFIPYKTFTSEIKTNYSDIKLRVPPIFIILWTIISIGAIIIFGSFRQVYLFCIAITQLCAIIGFLFAFPKSGFSFERHFSLLVLWTTSTLSTALLLLKMINIPFIKDFDIGGILGFISITTIICFITQRLYANFHKKSLCSVEVISIVVGYMSDYDIDGGIHSYNYTPIYEYYYNGKKYQTHNNCYADITMHCNKIEIPHNLIISRNPKHPWEQKYCNKSIKILPIKLKSLNESVSLKINPEDPYIFYVKN